jgi:hypothetical protein
MSQSIETLAAPIDEARAIEIARAFVSARQPAGTPLLDLSNQTPELHGSSWRIKLDAKVVPIPSQPSVGLHWIIEVDASGTPTLIAQG